MFINKDTKGHILIKQNKNIVILNKWTMIGMSNIYIKDQRHISLTRTALPEQYKKVIDSYEKKKVSKWIMEQKSQMSDALINV